MRSSDQFKQQFRHRANRAQSPSAFTLLEMMFVFVLIGLLAGLVTVSARHYLVKGKQNAARAEVASLCAALETYYASTSRYPTSEEGLDILARKSDRFPEPLLPQVPLDPWGHPYQYTTPGRSQPYEVSSLGADGREGGQGTDADIGSWNLKEGSKDAAFAAR